MKYKLNESPSYHVCPTIERINEKVGKIKYSAIYDDRTYIYMSEKASDMIVVGREVGKFNEIQLSSYSYRMLETLSHLRSLPLEELKEIRDLEKQYRESKKKS